ncbi:PA14 domain-containing protein, partial [Microbacterium radiodurans]
MTTALTLVLSGLAVMPAAAHEFTTPPLAQWPSPYSPLPTAQVVAANNTQLTFDGTTPGLHDGDGQDTGFTMVQPSTSEQSAAIDPGSLYQGYYLPQFLNVADGKLAINPTKGIAFLTMPANAANNDRWKNTQDNTLGLPVDSAGKKLVFTTTLSVPNNASDSAQGGIWFGPNDDNYVKLVVAATSATQRQIQISREVAGATNTNAGTVDQASVNNLTIPATTPVALTLTVDATTNTASASYKLGTGASVNVGSVPLPANFTNGDLVPTTFDTAQAQTNGFAGLFATRRNMTNETVAVPFVFDDFTVAEIDTVAPGAPVDITANATPNAVDVDWNAPADPDVAGYRVYRSATAPVALTAANLLTGSLLSDSKYTDERVFVGQTWNYAVQAVDAAGNASAQAATVSATVPVPTGDLVGSYDFTTAAGALAPGYTRDSGAPYSDAAGYGWVTADGDGPFDFSKNSRVRTELNGITDSRLTSLMHMQYGTASSTNPDLGVVAEQGVWERAVPNGRYSVVVAAGDTSNGNFDSSHTVVVEGVTAIDHFAGAAPVYFEQGIVEVEVTDGKLSIAAGTDPTTKNTKISFVQIFKLPTPALGTVPGLAAAFVDETDSVQVTWSAVAGATGYNVYRSTTSPVPTETPFNATPISGTSFTDADVDADTTYHYTVVAVSPDAPASAPAGEVSVSVPAEPVVVTPPAAPAGVSATADADSVTVGWSAADGATGYRVYRGTTPAISTTGTPLAELDAAARSFDDTTAAVGTTYHYVVVAVKDAAGTVAVSPASTVVSATVAEPVEPGTCEAWSGTYFAGKDLQGEPLATECLAELDRTLAGGDSPVPGVPASDYSARFTKTIDEGAGTYTFTFFHDDGVRILIDGERVFSSWSGSDGWSQKTVSVPLAAGPHEVMVEYFQAGGGAKLILDYEVTPAAECAASGWSGTYFAGKDLQGEPLATECLAELDRTLAGGDSPVPGVPASDYSARFTKTIDEGAGTYTFTFFHDDG